jgi:hypothetical protein
MNLNFKSFLLENGYTPPGIGPGSMVPVTWSNSDSELTTASRHIGWPSELPEDDFVIGPRPMNIPQVTRQGVVKVFRDKCDPMYIELSDKTKLFITPQQYENIRGHIPIVPDNTHLTVVFQRMPANRSLDLSQVAKIFSRFIGNSGTAAQYNVKINPKGLMLNL